MSDAPVTPEPAGAYAYVPPAPAPAPASPTDRPELLVGGAFAGGVLLALLLKRAGRVS